MARPPLFSALSVSLVVLVMGSSVLARPGRVTGPDGKKLEGDVTENKNDNTVEIVSNSDGKRYKFNDAALRGPVEYDDSIVIPQRGQPRPGQPARQPGQPPAQGGAGMSTEEEFAKRRAALAPTDAAGRVRLARWAFDRQEYDLAHEVAQEAVAIDRRNEEAVEMLR